MVYVRSSPRQRGASTVVAIFVTALLGLVLALGLAMSAGVPRADSLAVFEPLAETVALKRRAESPRKRSPRPEGEAAPPALRAEPSEVVAPDPLVALPPLQPVIAAPIAGIGAASSAGSAEIPGPGTGAGGEGDGRGSGGEGDGDGGGGGDETAPRRTRGSIRNSDYPAAAADAGASGTVEIRYLVQVDGRVGDCEVTRSSGNAALDATTCRLIEQRFRFRPSRDARGRAVPALIAESHEWVLQIEKAAEPERRKRRARIF